MWQARDTLSQIRDTMASLCSVTSSRKLLASYRRRRRDDRPFARSQKVILPIRGFKGNRILYGDSLDAVGEVTEEDTDDDDDLTEPVYSEPQFDRGADESQVSSSDISSGYLSQELSSQHHNNNNKAVQSLSSPESGYLSSDEDCLVFQQGEA